MSKFDSGSSIIKSIQKGVTSISSTNNSATSTITAVDTAKSFMGWGGDWGNADNFATSTGGVTLTNATTVTASRSASGSGTVSIRWTVVELV